MQILALALERAHRVCDSTSSGYAEIFTSEKTVNKEMDGAWFECAGRLHASRGRLAKPTADDSVNLMPQSHPDLVKIHFQTGTRRILPWLARTRDIHTAWRGLLLHSFLRLQNLRT